MILLDKTSIWKGKDSIKEPVVDEP